jgi:hypothetical protein
MFTEGISSQEVALQSRDIAVLVAESMGLETTPEPIREATSAPS